MIVTIPLPVCSIIKGKDLSASDLQIINSSRLKEFGSKSLISPAPDNDDWNKLYFLLKDASHKILAFGRLHEVQIKFLEIAYDVYGIATIVSVVKSQGYGKALMVAIKNFCESVDKTAIGFCNPSNTPFYKKCGYSILKGKVTQFVYKDSEGNLLHDERGGDVLYLQGKDELLNQIAHHPEELVYMSRKHW